MDPIHAIERAGIVQCQHFKNTIMDTIQNAAIALMLFSFLLEAILSAVQQRHLYDSKDAAVSILLGTLISSLSLAMKGLPLNLFLGLQEFALTQLETSWITAVVLFFISDLYYCSCHRLAHNCRFVWASHV